MMSSPCEEIPRDFSKSPNGNRVATRKPVWTSWPRRVGVRRYAATWADSGAHLEEEAPLVGGLPGAEVLHLDGVGRDARLPVEDLDLDQMRAPDLRTERQATDDGQVPE